MRVRVSVCVRALCFSVCRGQERTNQPPSSLNIFTNPFHLPHHLPLHLSHLLTTLFINPTIFTTLLIFLTSN